MREAGYFLMMAVMFWNMENFFDPFPERAGSAAETAEVAEKIGKGDEYTPGGKKHWTWRRFRAKRDLAAKTIIAAKELYGDYPALIGLCEVENRFVLASLVNDTPLASIGYGILHRDSPDRRGIDVAVLYRRSRFMPVEVRYLPEGRLRNFTTRYILYVKGVCRMSRERTDTLHIFVNHWPSKLGGAKRSLPARTVVSDILKEAVDSLLGINPSADIVVMGDFNDSPDSTPVRNLTGNHTRNITRNITGNPIPGRLYNFMEDAGLEALGTGLPDSRAGASSAAIGGTYKYKGRWERIDQFMVSPHLLSSEKQPDKDSGSYVDSQADSQGGGIFCTPGSASVFAAGHLLERDAKYLGDKIKRSFTGPRYTGGVSDHLPIVLKIYSLKEGGKINFASDKQQ